MLSKWYYCSKMFRHHVTALAKISALILFAQIVLLALNVVIALTPKSLYSIQSLKYPVLAATILYAVNAVCFTVLWWRFIKTHTEAAAIAMSTMVLLLPIIYWELNLGGF
jgi:hypothetical protein